MSHRNEFRRSLGAIVLCGLFGFGTLALTMTAVVEHALFMSTAEKAVGTVVRLERQDVTTTRKNRNGVKETRLEVRIYPVAAFTYQGATYEVRRGTDTRQFSSGDKVPIVFQPGNPREARFDEPDGMLVLVVSGLLFGLFFLGLGGHTLYDTRFRRTRASTWAAPPPVPQESASHLRLGEHVPGRKLVLKMASPGQQGWIAWTVGLGTLAASFAFLARAPLAGLGILAAAGAFIACALRWMTRQVDFTLAGVTVRRGFRRYRFERVDLRGVKLEPDPAKPADAFRLWLEPRASEQPIEVLHASFNGPSAVVQAHLRELAKALEGLDLRVN